MQAHQREMEFQAKQLASLKEQLHLTVAAAAAARAAEERGRAAAAEAKAAVRALRTPGGAPPFRSRSNSSILTD